MCLISETCSRFGVTPAMIFRRAVEAQHFTNDEEIYRDRLERWVKHGEVPPYVETYCRRVTAALKEFGHDAPRSADHR